MSEDKRDNEDEREETTEVENSQGSNDDTGEDNALVESDEDMEIDEFEEDEDEIDESELTEKKEETEIGACMVIGQGDFSMCQSNRGADDPGDNTLSEPQFIHKYGEYFFVSDRGNHRVMIWEQPPEENGEPGGIVLGQEDFADYLENRGMTTTLDEMTSGLGDESLDGFTISKSEEDTLSQPAGITVINGKLYVVDSGNHRTLRWGGLPSEDGEPPNLVFGQDNMDDNEANRRGLIGSGSLFFPMGIHSGDDQHIFMADKDNHRVLIWDKPPNANGWNADGCLGQAGFDERDPNRGEFDNVGADTLSFPTGVHYDAEADKLFVVDQGNHRVLIWNKYPNEVGKPADVVIGQKDFTSRQPNAGLGSRRSSVDGLYFPTHVVCGRAGLFISDTDNHRVLYWKEVPTENGQPADLVLGQKTFLENLVNRGGDATGSTLNDPFGLFLEEDPEDDFDDEDAVAEGEEETPPKFKLYIADRGNSRVVVWDELPYAKTEEEEDEELDAELEQDDPHALIGEDAEDEDDVMIEEEEEGPPEEVPSV